MIAACDFKPVYGPDGAGARLNRKVSFTEATTRETYTLVRALERQFGPLTRPDYLLDYRYRIRREDAAITSGEEIDRVNLIGTLEYSLRDQTNGAQLAKGTAYGVVSYSSAGDAVATSAARQDAQERLARIVAERCHAFLASNPKLAPSEAAK
ncbi:MAG: hypothetical protein OIF40_02220 [Mangrovicoccus sp.]|nr:hypothetical protein [Mangrovicoccus sp.]